MTDDGLLLVGLDGGNPLAFLASLGTLRSLALAWPDRRVRMGWRPGGGWRPFLFLEPKAEPAEVIDALDRRLRLMHQHPALARWDDLSVAPAEFQGFARDAVAVAHSSGDRTWADFAAAFGCEGSTTDNGQIQDTALRTMSGAGHQHFLKFMRIIVDRTTPAHLEKTLFQPWRYDDAVEKQTLRWDPADDVRRALRWRDPSGDPQRRRRGGMLGANRLAIEGLPLLPSMPLTSGLRTTGFVGTGAAKTFWHWPIWTGPLGLDAVRSLLALRELVTAPKPTSPRRSDVAEGSRSPDDSAYQEWRRTLRARGVAEVFRARRMTVDKFRSFTPAQPIEAGSSFFEHRSS